MLPASQLGGKAIDICAGADILIAELAVEHRPARHRNGRQVHACRSHQTGWRRFVAAGQQHHPVERIGADAFLHVHARQVAVEHGRWLHQRLAERSNRKFERKAPGLVHPALDLLGQDPQMGVARIQVRPRVADPDHGPAVEHLLGMALVFGPASGHKPLVPLVAKPPRTAQRFFIPAHGTIPMYICISLESVSQN